MTSTFHPGDFMEPLTRIENRWKEAEQIWRVGDRNVLGFYKNMLFWDIYGTIYLLPKSLLNICLIMIIRNDTEDALWPRRILLLNLLVISHKALEVLAFPPSVMFRVW